MCARRCGDASSTSTVSARQNLRESELFDPLPELFDPLPELFDPLPELFDPLPEPVEGSVTRARTRSPGMASETKTTLPSCRAMNVPPCAIPVMSRSSDAGAEEAILRGYGSPSDTVVVMQVCLASTSPARLMLLRQVGIEPLTRAPGTDEDAVSAAAVAVRGAELPPDELVLLLARAKASDVAQALRTEDPAFDGIVIGGDSMFALGGQVFGKPYTEAAATERWLEMRGATGVLHSGHSVFRVQPGQELREATAVAEASVTFADDITDAEITAYVASGEPLHVAGAFTVDSLGGAFITRVEGDPSTVVGMSLSTVRRLARELDVSWTDLWTTPQS
jgi:septum formation protein